MRLCLSTLCHRIGRNRVIDCCDVIELSIRSRQLLNEPLTASVRCFFILEHAHDTDRQKDTNICASPQIIAGNKKHKHNGKQEVVQIRVEISKSMNWKACEKSTVSIIFLFALHITPWSLVLPSARNQAPTGRLLFYRQPMENNFCNPQAVLGW